MIFSRKADKKEDIAKIKEAFNYEGELTAENRVVYIMTENDTILGFSVARTFENEAELEHIEIEASNRRSKLGDGLLRAILNSLHLNGIEEVYVKEKNEFLIWEKFEEAEGKYQMKCNLQAFFSRGCRR